MDYYVTTLTLTLTSKVLRVVYKFHPDPALQVQFEAFDRRPFITAAAHKNGGAV